MIERQRTLTVALGCHSQRWLDSPDTCPILRAAAVGRVDVGIARLLVPTRDRRSYLRVAPSAVQVAFLAQLDGSPFVGEHAEEDEGEEGYDADWDDYR